jgi:excisionase family DNA binding protein
MAPQRARRVGAFSNCEPGCAVKRSDKRAAMALLTVEQVADHCQTSVRSVRRWVSDGAIACVRIGRSVRIAEQDLAAFLALRRTPI